MIRWFSSRTLLSGSWLCPGSYSHAPPFMQNVLSGETSSHQSRHRETPRRQRPNKCCLNKMTKVEQNSLNCGFSHIRHLLFRVSNGRCETESWWQWKYLCFCSDTTLTFYLSHKIVVPAQVRLSQAKNINELISKNQTHPLSRIWQQQTSINKIQREFGPRGHTHDLLQMRRHC